MLPEFVQVERIMQDHMWTMCGAVRDLPESTGQLDCAAAGACHMTAHNSLHVVCRTSQRSRWG